MKAKHIVVILFLGIVGCATTKVQDLTEADLSIEDIHFEHLFFAFENQSIDLDSENPNDEMTGIRLIGIHEGDPATVTISFEGKILEAKEDRVFPVLIKNGLLVVSYAGRENGEDYASLEFYVPPKEILHRFNMKKLLGILVGDQSSVGLEENTKSNTDGLGATFRKSLKAMDDLKAGLKFPEHLACEGGIKRGDEFDVQKYFTILRHLSMKKDYQLDYVYNYHKMGGKPVLYSRKRDWPPYASHKDFIEAIRKRAHMDEIEKIEKESRKREETDGVESAQEWRDKQLAAFPDHEYWKWYLDDVRVDGTPQGWLELVALSLLGDQFYLFWHANCNDARIIPDHSSLSEITKDTVEDNLKVPPIITLLGTALDVRPVVKIDEKSVFVSLVTFSNWGGFEEVNFTINRESPYRIKKTSYTLIDYHCGVFF